MDNVALQNMLSGTQYTTWRTSCFCNTLSREFRRNANFRLQRVTCKGGGYLHLVKKWALAVVYQQEGKIVKNKKNRKKKKKKKKTEKEKKKRKRKKKKKPIRPFSTLKHF